MTHTDGTISITVNGEHRRVAGGLTLAGLANELGLAPEKVAVERNMVVVPRSTLDAVALEDGDELEIVHFVGGGDHDDTWTVAGRTFRSRLIVGTGKYRDFAQNAAALEASGGEPVLAALADPVFRKKLEDAGITPLPEAKEQFARRIRRDIEVWKPMIEMAGIKPE